MTEDKHITVAEDGQVLAEAIVTAPDGDRGARAQVHVASGHLPVGTRQKMADAVHETVAEAVSDTVPDGQRAHLTATVPLGDVELVEGIGGRLDDVQLRAAGATSIIEGEVRPG